MSGKFIQSIWLTRLYWARCFWHSKKFYGNPFCISIYFQIWPLVVFRKSNLSAAFLQNGKWNFPFPSPFFLFWSNSNWWQWNSLPTRLNFKAVTPQDPLELEEEGFKVNEQFFFILIIYLFFKSLTHGIEDERVDSGVNVAHRVSDNLIRMNILIFGFIVGSTEYTIVCLSENQREMTGLFFHKFALDKWDTLWQALSQHGNVSPFLGSFRKNQMTHHFQILANVEAVVLLRIFHFESKGCLAAIITRVLD